MFRGVAALRRLFREFNRGIVQFTRWIGYLLFRCFLGLWSWARARSWSNLLQALPAMSAAVLVVVLFGLKSGLPAQELESRYREESNDAVAKREWGRVILCQDRLVQLGEGDPKSLYNYALALDKLGRSDRAMQVMKQIAPDNQQGYAEANLWIAQRYFLSSEPGHRQIVIENCEQALQRVGELSDHGNQARQVLAELYLRMGAEKEAKEPDEARKYFQKSADQFKTIVETWSHMHLRYAQVLRELKLKQQSGDEANQAIKYFEARIKANSKDASARLGWADSLSFLGKYEQAIDVLVKAPTKTLEDIYKHALAQTYLEWQQSIAKESPKEVAKQINLLGRGLHYEPTNPFLLDRLLWFLSRDGEDFNLVAAEVAKFNAENGGTATSKFVAGMVAYRKGNTKEAEILFEQALKREPDFPILLNNFAWMLVEKKDATVKDVDRALELVNLALKSHPGEPSFLDTRGTVYMRQQKWKEALEDLEYINFKTPEFRGARNRHARLSAIYKELGLLDQSKAHYQKATE
jgi:tetratricopeptide (TPR) repeat protein